MNCNFKLRNYDSRTCNDALLRARSGGSSVPKKVGGKYIYTLDKIAQLKSIKYGDGILMIYDYGQANDAEDLKDNFTSLDNNADFQTSIGYSGNIKNQLKTLQPVFATINSIESIPVILYQDSYLGSVNHFINEPTFSTNTFDTLSTTSLYDFYKDEIKNNSAITDIINYTTFNVEFKDSVATYYNGEDLTLTNYKVIVLFTKQGTITQTPTQFFDTQKTTIDGITRITRYNYSIPNLTGNIEAISERSTTINHTKLDANNIKKPAHTIVTISETVTKKRFTNSFGRNLQNYINSGGNAVLGNNIWQNESINGFDYNNIPFIYKNNYTYTDDTTITSINVKFPSHPIFKGVTISNDNQISLNLNEQKIIDATEQVFFDNRLNSVLLATYFYNGKEIPFIAAYSPSPVGGSRIVCMNSYLSISTSPNNTNFNKIVYNSIYWCTRENN